MKRKKQKPRSKPHFCHDINIEFRKLKKECNRLAHFDSVVTLLKDSTVKDSEIISYCNKFDYHIITHNTPDFLKVPASVRIGIFCVGLADPKKWIPKFIRLMKIHPKHSDLYGKTFVIGESVVSVDRE